MSVATWRVAVDASDSSILISNTLRTGLFTPLHLRLQPDNQQPMFFAGSDDESDQEITSTPESLRLVQSVDASASGTIEDVNMEQTTIAFDSEEGHTLPARTQGLFFADSDDEDDKMHIPSIPLPALSITKEDPIVIEDDEDLGYIDIPQVSSPSHPSSSAASSASSPPTARLSRSPSLEAIEPPKKKMRISSNTENAPSGNGHTVGTFQPLTHPFVAAYLGSFIVGNAWSTVKGKGYCKAGEEIIISRDDPDSLNPSSSKPEGKTKMQRGAVKGKSGAKKQLTLATLIKQPAKAKKKTDTAVRIMNTRGFGAFVRCNL